MKYGDRVLWQYTHATGRRTRFERVKAGEYLAKCRHTVKHWRKYGAVQMAYVKFDGNKTYSLVPLEDLRLEAKS
jgi:hypothetical protein